MFSCLLEVRFAGVLLEGTAVSLLSDAENSGFDESASARFLEGVIGRVCNGSINDTYETCSRIASSHYRGQKILNN